MKFDVQLAINELKLSIVCLHSVLFGYLLPRYFGCIKKMNSVPMQSCEKLFRDTHLVPMINRARTVHSMLAHT